MTARVARLRAPFGPGCLIPSVVAVAANACDTHGNVTLCMPSGSPEGRWKFVKSNIATATKSGKRSGRGGRTMFELAMAVLAVPPAQLSRVVRNVVLATLDETE